LYELIFLLPYYVRRTVFTGKPAALDCAEICTQFAVLFAFVASQKHTDRVTLKKTECNRAGLHHRGLLEYFRRFWFATPEKI
jgi:hypothetical protein